jgi:hypothetical protein
MDLDEIRLRHLFRESKGADGGARAIAISPTRYVRFGFEVNQMDLPQVLAPRATALQPQKFGRHKKKGPRPKARPKFREETPTKRHKGHFELRQSMSQRTI